MHSFRRKHQIFWCAHPTIDLYYSLVPQRSDFLNFPAAFAQAMMKDPAFRKQMDDLLQSESFQRSMKLSQDLMRDPKKMQAVQREINNIMEGELSPHVPSPVWTHGFCMRHRVIWCATSAAVDSTPLRPVQCVPCL
jgi:hypothetical protein